MALSSRLPRGRDFFLASQLLKGALGAGGREGEKARRGERLQWEEGQNGVMLTAFHS